MAEQHMDPDALRKLRRFSMALSLVSITYSFAVVEPSPPYEFTLLGMKFSLRNPNLIPVALLIAALYSAIRYYFFAFALLQSPAAGRRTLFGKHGIESSLPARVGELRFDSAESREAFRDDLARALPAHVSLRTRIVFSQKYDTVVDQGRRWYTIRDLEIPRSTRWSARLLDLDYRIPLLLAPVAVVLAAVKFGWPSAIARQMAAMFS